MLRAWGVQPSTQEGQIRITVFNIGFLVVAGRKILVINLMTCGVHLYTHKLAVMDKITL